MRVLGIDPGLQITGYGCVRIADGAIEPTLIEAGVLKFRPRDAMARRLAEMHQSLSELIDELRPDGVVVEKLYAHYRHPRTAILMGHARGVILLTAQQKRTEVIDLPSTEVKKALTGNGHASKEQVQRAVQAQYRLAEMPSPPDVADAIAIATCYARRLAMERISR